MLTFTWVAKNLIAPSLVPVFLLLLCLGTVFPNLSHLNICCMRVWMWCSRCLATLPPHLSYASITCSLERGWWSDGPPWLCSKNNRANFPPVRQRFHTNLSRTASLSCQRGRERESMKNINKVENKKSSIGKCGSVCSVFKNTSSLFVKHRSQNKTGGKLQSALLSEELFLCNLVLPHGMFSLKPFDLSEKTWTVIGQTFYHILSQSDLFRSSRLPIGAEGEVSFTSLLRGKLLCQSVWSKLKREVLRKTFSAIFMLFF